MPSAASPPATGRVAFRCDGDERVGAGHVARCVPLAAAFVQLGWDVAFVGVYGGLASWLLARAGMVVRPPDLDTPCGVAAGKYDAAVVDSYSIAPAAICDLAQAMPVVTLGEANRCDTTGILVDYHLDGAERVETNLLAGPSFAPLDPAFAGAGRAGNEIRRVLVTLGGSKAARELLAEVAPIVARALPDADIVLANADPPKTSTAGTSRPTETSSPAETSRPILLASPSALVDMVADIDVAVTAAGLTAYELACAGIPQVAIGIVANQRRVVQGLRAQGLAPCLDLTAGDSLADLPQALERLQDPQLRRALAERGKSVFDGQGALRTATALIERFACYRPAAATAG